MVKGSMTAYIRCTDELVQVCAVIQVRLNEWVLKGLVWTMVYHP